MTSFIRSNKFRRTAPVIFAVTFAGIGALLLLMTKAATPSSSMEAEFGDMSGNVAVITDDMASGKSAIQFNAPSPTPTPPPTPTPTPPLPDTAKKLLLFQQQRITAEYIGSHAAEINALPFEGVIFRTPSMDAMLSGSPFSTDHFKTEFAPYKAALPQLTKVKENFVTFRLMKPSPFETYTSVMAANMANAAEAARDAGLKGIVYDNEEHGTGVWTPETACPGDTLEQCKLKAREAGKTVMRAMIAKWPTIKFMTTLGPFFGHQPSILSILNINTEPKLEVLGAFTVGLNEAAIGTEATYIDGGEVYSTSTQAKADNNYNVRKNLMPQQSELIAPAIKTAWAAKMSLAFAIYDKAYAATTAQWQNDLKINAAKADQYTWAWSERFAWVGTPEGGRTVVPQAYIDATKAGRVEAGLPPMPQ